MKLALGEGVFPPVPTLAVATPWLDAPLVPLVSEDTDLETLVLDPFRFCTVAPTDSWDVALSEATAALCCERSVGVTT
jgi:hypothetical protein